MREGAGHGRRVSGFGYVYAVRQEWPPAGDVLVAPIDPADLEVTIRTLQGITARARALLAAGAGEAA